MPKQKPKGSVLAQYERACNAIIKEFVQRYFCDEDSKLEDLDWWWIGDEIGGVAHINDYFFEVARMVEAIRYKATPKQVFDYYDFELEKLTKGEPVWINFKNFIKSKK